MGLAADLQDTSQPPPDTNTAQPAPSLDTTPQSFTNAVSNVSAGASSLADQLSNITPAPIKQYGPAIAKTVLTPLQWAGEGLRRLTEQPITGTAQALQEGTSVPQALWQGLTGERKTSFADVLQNDPAWQANMANLPSEVKEKLTGTMGDIASFTNPIPFSLNFSKPLKALGKVTSTGLSKALDLGEQLPGVAGKTVGKARSLADTLQEGFTPITRNPEFNALKQNEINSSNYETHLQNLTTPENSRIITDNAASMGITPQEARERMLDYIEPPTSPLPNWPKETIINKEELTKQPEVPPYQKIETPLGKEGTSGVMVNSRFAPVEEKPISPLRGHINDRVREILTTEPSEESKTLYDQYGKRWLGNTPTSIPGEERPGVLASQPGARTPATPEGQLEVAREQYGQKLTPELRAYADEIRQMHEERAAAEDQRGILGTVRQNYIEHQLTPDAKDFFDETFNNDDKQQFHSALEKISKPNDQTRNVPLTINEANNLSAAGRGNEIPGLGQWPQLQNYKGKLFNDQIEDLAAHRYLTSVKATNEHDFLQAAGKTYGKSEDYIKANEDPEDWVKVTKPSFSTVEGNKDNTLWFPKEIGNYLNRSEQLTTGKYLQPIANGFKWLNNFTKKMNFGIWPGSAVKIELGNQKLAYLSDLWSPHSQFVGHSIATKVRQDGINALDATKPIIYSPKLGALTERDIYQLAMQNRGIGMGLAQQELESMRPGERGLGPAKAGWALHNYVEDGTRMGTFIDALKKGYDAKGAGEATMKALYDYSSMGPIPNTVRKFLPFFTFAYKNGPAMVGKLATNPGKMALYDRIRQVVNKPVADQEQNEREWQTDNMPVYMGTGKDGKNYYLYGNKFMPETDIDEFLGSGKTVSEALENTPAKMMQYAFNMQNPYLKTLIEEGFNRSSYFNQEIQRMKGEQAQTGLGFNAPAKVAYAIRNTVRAPSEVGRATDQTIPLPLRLAHLLGGFNIQAEDPVVQQLNHARDLRKQINGSGSQEGGKADIKYYEGLLAHYTSTGDKAKAELAKKNLDTAIKNLQETLQNIGQ